MNALYRNVAQLTVSALEFPYPAKEDAAVSRAIESMRMDAGA